MKNPLLYIGIGLIVFGLLKPNLSNIIPGSVVTPNSVACLDNYVISPPDDVKILEKCNLVVDVLQKHSQSNKKDELLRLSSLYADIGTLIRLSDENVVIKDTQSIKQINSLCGLMLNLDIKGKYPELASAAQSVVVTAIGDDDTTLNNESRENAAEAFDGLSWAFYEGAK